MWRGGRGLRGVGGEYRVTKLYIFIRFCAPLTKTPLFINLLVDYNDFHSLLPIFCLCSVAVKTFSIIHL